MSGLSKTTPIASSGIKRMLVGTGALSLVFAGMVTIGETPEASATTCGYHTEHIDREHNWGDVTIPVVDVTVPFPGGRVETAFWGNCSGGNEKIKVNAASGDYEVCVNPGDSQLGTTREGKKISGASKIGAC